MSKGVRYVIEFEKERRMGVGEYVLYSVVATNFGGDAVNFVASSSDKQIVENIKNQLGGE